LDDWTDINEPKNEAVVCEVSEEKSKEVERQKRSGEGGNSFFGGGAQSIGGDNNGRDAQGIGGGGSGATVNNITTNYTGGAGSDGIVVVYEYL
jgi:hypothetical protein